MSALTSMILKNDVLCFYALNRRFHCRALDLVMKSLTHLGSTAAAIVISMFLLLYNRNMGITLAINLLSSQFIIHLIKRIVDRPRPYKTLEWAIAINPPKCRYSLPSGHSGSVLSIAMTLASFFPMLRVALLAVAVLVGVSRVYLGVHYPTDVTLGFAIAVATYEVFTRMTFMSFLV